MTGPAILTFAYILDLAMGDPAHLPHPVKGIGWAIEKTEGLLRKRLGKVRHITGRREKLEKRYGLLLCLLIFGSVYVSFFLLNVLLHYQGLSSIIDYLSFLFLVYLVSTTIATRELLQSGQAVMHELNTGSMQGARKKLAMIVGRDTHSLDKKGVLKAVIETLSENASDGIIAPMFYFAIGGLPLAMAYKAVNTLDSMVGYKNDKYGNFGRVSARLDDIANFIPARLTGFLIVSAAFAASIFKYLVHYTAKRFDTVQHSARLDYIEQNLQRISFRGCISAVRTMIKDGRKHASPNAGIPEAAMAGSLGIRLGGASSYGGVAMEKPGIGEEIPDTENRNLNRAELYMQAARSAVSITKLTSFLGLVVALGILFIRMNIWN